MSAVGLGRGGVPHVGGGAAAWYPTDSTSFEDFWDASVSGDFSLSGSNVISWTGRRGTHVFTDLSNPARRPSISAAALNGNDAVLFNGITEWLNCSTIDMPAPPFCYYMGFRYVTCTSFDVVMHSGSTAAMIGALYVTSTAATSLTMANGTTVGPNAGLGTTGVWKRVYTNFYDNSGGNDELLVGSTSATGSAGTTNAGAGLNMGARKGDASTFANIEMLFFGVAYESLSAPDLALMDAWVTSKYGSGLV